MKPRPPTNQNLQEPSLKEQLVYLYDSVFCPDELLSDKCRNRRLYLFAFFVPVFMMVLVYFSIGARPFVGPNSVLVLDMNAQYVYFFSNLRSILLEGNSFLYSWSRSLGGEFLGMYAYYLASPLSWLVVLFPETMITDAIWFMLVIKTGICGLTASVFLNKVYPSRSLHIVLFSALYAFCSYNLAYMSNIMWMDAVMLLPLLVLGIEQLLSDRKYILYTSTLALIILSNFYIGFMVCIFTVLYFIYYHIARYRITGTYSETERYFFVKSLLRIGFFSILAVTISAVILLPAYHSLQLGKMGGGYTQNNLELNHLFDILSKLFFGHTDTIRPSGLPFIYSGTIVLLTLPLFFSSPKIKIREKIGAGFLLLAFIFSMLIPAVDVLWHGGQEPNWMNHRYSFIFSFLLIIFAYRGFNSLNTVKFRIIPAAGIVSGILLIGIRFQNYGDRYGYTDFFSYNYNIPLVYGSLFLLAVLIILLYFYRRSPAVFRKKRSISAVLTFMVLFEAYAAGVLQNTSLAMDVAYSTRASYVDFLQSTQPAVDYVQQLDDGFYRMEKTFCRAVNDNMALNMRGISGSASTYHAQALSLLHRMGYRAETVSSWHYGGNPVNDSILGIKYMIDDANQFSQEFYDLLYEDEKNERYVYQNPYALSLAFAAHEDILDLDLSMSGNPFEYLNSLLSALVGDEINAFVRADVTQADDTAFPPEDGSDEHNHTSFCEHTEHDLITYTGCGTGDFVYLYISSYWLQKSDVYVNGEKIELNNASDRADNIIPIGKFSNGEQYEISVRSENENLYPYENTCLFYSLNMEVFQNAMAELRENQLNILPGFSEHCMTGIISMPEERSVLFTSIPFDKNWQIYVDGEQVHPDTTGKTASLLMLELSPGEHEIVFEYKPHEFILGMEISIAGMICFGIIIGIDSYKRKKYCAKNGSLKI